MMFIRDQLQIKTIQRILNRNLTRAEMSGSKPIQYRDQNGEVRITRIKLYPLSYFFTKR